VKVGLGGEAWDVVQSLPMLDDPSQDESRWFGNVCIKVKSPVVYSGWFCGGHEGPIGVVVEGICGIVGRPSSKFAGRVSTRCASAGRRDG
jgi:hypothetical protein